MRLHFYFIILSLLCGLPLTGQTQFAVLSEEVCWTTPGEVDSTLVRYSRFSTRRNVRQLIGYYNSDMTLVSPSGGTIAFGNCCCNGSGVSSLNGVTNFENIGDTLMRITLQSGTQLDAPLPSSATVTAENALYVAPSGAVRMGGQFIEETHMYDSTNTYGLTYYGLREVRFDSLDNLFRAHSNRENDIYWSFSLNGGTPNLKIENYATNRRSLLNLTNGGSIGLFAQPINGLGNSAVARADEQGLYLETPSSFTNDIPDGSYLGKNSKTDGPVSYIANTKACWDTVYNITAGVEIGDPVIFTGANSYDTITTAGQGHHAFVVDTLAPLAVGEGSRTVIMLCGQLDTTQMSEAAKNYWQSIADDDYYLTDTGVDTSADNVFRPLYSVRAGSVSWPVVMFGQGVTGSAVSNNLFGATDILAQSLQHTVTGYNWLFESGNGWRFGHDAGLYGGSGWKISKELGGGDFIGFQAFRNVLTQDAIIFGKSTGGAVNMIGFDLFGDVFRFGHETGDVVNGEWFNFDGDYVQLYGLPTYVDTATAGLDSNLPGDSFFLVDNGDGTSSIYLKN